MRVELALTSPPPRALTITTQLVALRLSRMGLLPKHVAWRNLCSPCTSCAGVVALCYATPSRPPAPLPAASEWSPRAKQPLLALQVQHSTPQASCRFSTLQVQPPTTQASCQGSGSAQSSAQSPCCTSHRLTPAASHLAEPHQLSSIASSSGHSLQLRRNRSTDELAPAWHTHPLSDMHPQPTYLTPPSSPSPLASLPGHTTMATPPWHPRAEEAAASTAPATSAEAPAGAAASSSSKVSDWAEPTHPPQMRRSAPPVRSTPAPPLHHALPETASPAGQAAQVRGQQQQLLRDGVAAAAAAQVRGQQQQRRRQQHRLCPTRATVSWELQKLMRQVDGGQLVGAQLAYTP